MSSVSAVASPAGVANATQVALSRNAGTSDEFLQLLVTKLLNQGPSALAPSSAQAAVTARAALGSSRCPWARADPSPLPGQSLVAASALIGSYVVALLIPVAPMTSLTWPSGMAAMSTSPAISLPPALDETTGVQ